MIEASNVTVKFKRGFRRKPIQALNGFNLKVERGDIFALLGPNGAGKSTAMYCLLGLIQPNKGEVRINGIKPQPGSNIFKKISYVPEEPHYHLYLTVEEALTFYGSLYGSRVSKQTVDSVIDRLGLSAFRDLRLEKCSKGMKQKVGLGTCLLNFSEIVFLDEPTRGLDPLMVKEFREIILEMNRNGTTVVMNSHVLPEVQSICNRIAIMEKGRVVMEGKLSELLQRDTESYVVVFDSFGSPPEYVKIVRQDDQKSEARIPLNSIQDFFRLAAEKQIKVYECNLVQSSLEDAFLRAVQGVQT